MKTAEKVKARDIASALKDAGSVAIFGHVLPDDDCIGSVYGMRSALENSGKKVHAYTDSKIPYHLEFLGGYSNLKPDKDIYDVQIVLVFDASSVDRVESEETLRGYREQGVPIYQIDHHMPGDLNDFADYTWQDQSFSSTSEMAMNIIREMGVPIKKDVATLLLAGIEGDTGSFQHQNTTEHSLESAAYLMSKGARFRAIVDNAVNSKKDLDLLKLYGLVLERIVYNKKYKTITSYLTLEDAKKFGVEGNSYSEVVNFFNVVGDIKMIVLITERKDGVIKVSLRTRDESVDVQKLAALVGGGGHVKASGFSIKGKIEAQDGQVKVV